MNIATTRTAHRPATPRRRSFLGKVLKGLKEWEQSEVLNTDAAPTYAAAIAELNAESKRPNETRHRQVKYLDNVVESRPWQAQAADSARARVQDAEDGVRGFEVMRALRKGQAGMFALQEGIVGEARIVERAFGLGPCILTEVMALLQDRQANADA